MFKLYASGDSNQINIFLNDLKSNPRYDVAIEQEQCYDEENTRGKVVMSVNLKPVTPLSVILHTQSGDQITIDLLKSIIVNNDGVTHISGKAYDIFG